MLRVALTGGIACGKSTVLKMFQQQDLDRIFALSADSLVHRLYAPGTPVYSQVVTAFGESILALDKKIDRGKLADVAFSTPEKRKQLEAIVHPAVIQGEIDWMTQVEREHPRARIAIIEIPLLFETGSEKRFAKTIAVTCSPQQSIERFRQRHKNITEEQARAEVERRSQAQLPCEEKARRADYVIDNSKGLAQLDAAVRRTCAEILKSVF
ncbi:MAG: dephospho-CoA kinase [Terriglobales bacterium]|jgi:dephospho-CoA kinase